MDSHPDPSRFDSESATGHNLAQSVADQHSPPGSPLVLHVPHASQVIPAEYLESMDAVELLKRDILELTDWYTDELLDSSASEPVVVRFPVSRFLVDPERYEDDSEESMAKHGMGVVYTHLSDGTPYRTRLSAESRERLIEKYYRPHHRALEQAVSRAVERFGYCLLIDVHSFPHEPTPVHHEQYSEGPIPDICIGTDSVHTPVPLIKMITQHAEEAGFSVAIDHPFKGTMVPSACQGDARVRSVMIEFNKRLYLHAGTNKKNEGFSFLREWGIALVNKLIVYAVQQEHLNDSFACMPSIDVEK